MLTKLRLRGHIIDSLVLSKLLDMIGALGVECYATDIKIGRRREDVSEAVFVIETSNEVKMEKAIEIAKEHGALAL